MTGALSRHGGFLSADEQCRLEAHRRALWDQLQGTIQEQLLAEKVICVYGQDVLQFPSGSAIPADAGRCWPIVAEAYRNYRKGYRRIRVEGHTDNVPIGTREFPSNWELSAARAIWLAKEIERSFSAKGVAIGPKGALVEAVGYGDSKPVKPNDTEAHRRLNRRIEIVFEK